MTIRSGLSIDTSSAQFHPISHYGSPAAVLRDAKLSIAEKRLILSSWASDMYAVDSQPALREIPGIAHPLRLSEILGALRQLDHEDQPPRPRGGAAMRITRPIHVNALGESVRPGRATLRRFSREANVQRYRKLLATKLTDHERRFVERRLAEELQETTAPPARRSSAG
jgi:hypothetical protein